MEQATPHPHTSSSPLHHPLCKSSGRRCYPAVHSIQTTESRVSTSTTKPSISLKSQQSAPKQILTFQELHRSGAIVSDAGVLAAAAALMVCGESAEDSSLGLQIHALLAKSGLDAESPLRSNVLWNKIVMLVAENESWLQALELFRKMQSNGAKADEVTIAKILAVCGRVEALELGREIHGHVIRSGLFSIPLVSNSLITMYSKNSSMHSARRAFDFMPCKSLVSWNSIISCYSLSGCLAASMELLEAMVSSGMEPDLVTWNSLISGHAHHGCYNQVFKLFREMQVKGLKPDSSTITSVLRSVIKSDLIKSGKEIHGYVMRHGLDCSVYIGSSLIDMYSKCCRLAVARALFDSMKQRNVVTWNSLITGYAYAGYLDEALALLKTMEGEGLQPNLTTWNSLITGYSTKGQSKQALVLIRQLKVIGLKPNVVSWTAVISGSCQNEQYEDSLNFLIGMQKEGIEPNSATLAVVLRACAGLALLHKGAELHGYAMRKGFDGGIYVSTGIIDMYCKSGSLRNAHRVFKKIHNKTLASWNAMIAGLAVYGLAEEAFRLFDEMCTSGVKPDGITFTALLSSCRHSGLIDEGWKYFDKMKNKYGVAPRIEHYASMVDLLGRGGYLDEALDFIEDMPFEPDASLWGALLGACRIHRNLEIAETAARHLFKLEPRNSANCLMMMSLYAHHKRWEDVENSKIAMDAAGLQSKAGWSWIQVGKTIHVFTREGNQHPDIGEIYFELYQLVSEIRRLGYVPDTSCISHNVEEQEKEKLLMGHTEKLAITYGLIKTSKNTAFRVIKNTRVCNDCHTVAKYLSEITGREIYLRDGIRFHHFRSGKCSCNDYW